MLILKALFASWKAEVSKAEPNHEVRLHMHMLQCQMALTYEMRCKAIRDFKAIKQRDWKAWLKQQLES